MQALRSTVKRSRANVWVVQKRFDGGNWVPAEMPIIKAKWRSVDVVGKITETMRNIAAGKLPSSEKFLGSTRPFAAVAAPMFETETPPAGIKKKLHVVVGCERGLCGVVGANLPKNMNKLTKSETDFQHEVVVVGKKTASKCKATQGPLQTEAFVGVKTKMPTFAFCLQVADRILSTKEFDQLTFHYNVYKNTQTFYLASENMYSLDLSTQIAGVQFPSYDVEGDERTILQNLQEFKFASTLYNCMAEQLASEMGSRLQSMDSASKTCKEKSKDYEAVYQKLRKTKITNELTVLSTGAKLAKKK